MVYSDRTYVGQGLGPVLGPIHFTLQLMWELKLDQDHIEITVQHTVSSLVRSPGKVQNGLETHSLSS